jgi:TonB family protein
MSVSDLYSNQYERERRRLRKVLTIGVLSSVGLHGVAFGLLRFGMEQPPPQADLVPIELMVVEPSAAPKTKEPHERPGFSQVANKTSQLIHGQVETASVSTPGTISAIPSSLVDTASGDLPTPLPPDDATEPDTTDGRVVEKAAETQENSTNPAPFTDSDSRPTEDHHSTLPTIERSAALDQAAALPNNAEHSSDSTLQSLWNRFRGHQPAETANHSRPPAQSGSRRADLQAGHAAGDGSEDDPTAPPASSSAQGSATGETAAGEDNHDIAARNTGRGEPPPASGSNGDSGRTRTVACLSCVKPDYPSSALAAGAEGQPRVNIYVNPDGTVANVTLTRSSGNAAIDRAALQAARRSRFHPIVGGATVPIEYNLTIPGSQLHQEAMQQGERRSTEVSSPAVSEQPPQRADETTSDPTPINNSAITSPPADEENPTVPSPTEAIADDLPAVELPAEAVTDDLPTVEAHTEATTDSSSTIETSGATPTTDSSTANSSPEEVPMEAVTNDAQE